jgi:hypothetical protein
VDAGGNAYITGTSLDPGSQANYTTLKYNRNGIQQWVSIYRGPASSDHIPVGIAVSKNYNYVYVTGQSQGSGSFDDYATIRYNPSNGDSVWVRRFNGTANFADVPYDLAVDIQGNAYVTGRATMAGTSYDYVTIKYSPAGNDIWTAVYNYANLGDIATGLKVDSSGNVYITGGTYTGNHYDYLTIKYSQPTGIEPLTNEIPNVFKLYQNYPNPFNSKSKIKFQIAKLSSVKILIYDILGREINTLLDQELKPGTYDVNWDAANYPSGVYLYRLVAMPDGRQAGNFIQTNKMMVIK